MTDRINAMLRDLDGLATAVGAVSPGPWRLGPRYDDVWIEDDLGKVVTLEKSRGYWFAKYMEALSPTTVFTLIRLAREGQRAERLSIEAKDYADSAQEDNERLHEEKVRLERELVEWMTVAQRVVDLFDPVNHEVSPASLALTASAVKEANADLRDRVSKLTTRCAELFVGAARILQETSLPDKSCGWEGERAALVAEVCTLRARVAELERRGTNEDSTCLGTIDELLGCKESGHG